MARRIREISSTGIYHVMLRGINKQNIFFAEDDYLRMMKILRDAPFEKDPLTGKVVKDNLCTIYAYCILDNHVHILIREGEMKISEVMQSIELRYALYYNKKYERVGHLFQGRFESEAVNDSPYFYTLLRYIHRNPVKALEAKTPEEYPYSSWNEYINYPTNLMRVLKPEAIAIVIQRYSLSELTKWVKFEGDEIIYTDSEGNEIVIKANNCLDMDRFPNPISDREAFEILSEITGLANPEDFRLLDAPTQIFYLLQAIGRGVKLKQAARLGTLSYYQIRKAFNKKLSIQKRGDSSIAGSDPSVDKNVEILDPRLEALNQAMRKIENLLGESPDDDFSELECSKDESQKEDNLMTENEYHHALLQVQDAIRHMEGLSKKTYHRLHLIAEYLHAHPESKCHDIATHIQASNERTRILLMQLANANIIKTHGNARSRTYNLI